MDIRESTLDFHLYLLVSGTDGLREAIEGGVDLVQFRYKGEDEDEMLDALLRVHEVCREAGVPLIINDRAGLVASHDAAGVHLGQDDMPVVRARHFVGPDRVIGVSVKDAEEAVRAEADGADYVALGPVFATGSKVVDIEPVGPQMLDQVMARVDVPVVAIGGINAFNVDKVVSTGCTRVAVINGVLGEGDPRENARTMKDRIERGILG